MPLRRLRSLWPQLPLMTSSSRVRHEGRKGDAGLRASPPGRSRQERQGRVVEYGPGGYSSAHTHAKSALIYATVLEGAILSAVNGGETKTFIAGQNFTELPGDHTTSAPTPVRPSRRSSSPSSSSTDDDALTTPRKP